MSVTNLVTDIINEFLYLVSRKIFRGRIHEIELLLQLAPSLLAGLPGWGWMWTRSPDSNLIIILEVAAKDSLEDFFGCRREIPGLENG